MTFPLVLGADALGGGGEVDDGDGEVLPMPSPTPTNWESLRGVIAAARADAAAEADRRPSACPTDGEPLVQARGVLHCRYCGYIWRG